MFKIFLLIYPNVYLLHIKCMVLYLQEQLHLYRKLEDYININ